MFIDLTRHGGGRVLRVASAAIAYLDACEGGTAVHLVGGETLRVAEDPATIEERSAPRMLTCEVGEVMSAPALTADAIVDVWVRITDTARKCPSELPQPGAPGAIDEDLELDGLRLAEGAGVIALEQAHEQRADIVTRRRRRR